MIHKTTKRFTSMLIILMLTTAVAVHAYQSAPPPLPASFYGTVSGDMNEDVVVIAVIKNEAIAQTNLISDGDEWAYSLIVPGDIPNTKTVEGGNPGDTVEFYINGQAATQTAVWQSGSNTQLNLTAGAGMAMGTIVLWLFGGLALAVLVMALVMRRNSRATANHLSLQEKTSW